MALKAVVKADFDEGNRRAAAGDWQGAIAVFDRCLAQNPQDWQALANRANARQQLGDNARALDDYMAASALNPASANIKSNLAVLLKELGELQLASQLLEEALAAEPAHVDAWSNLGVVRQHQLRYHDAIACFLKAIELGGVTAARCNNLGNVCTSALLLDDAISVLQGGLALSPQDANLQFSLSIALLLAGRYAEAWPLYEARWRSILTPRHEGARWDGAALGTRTLLLWAEQGLGDSLQMARFLPRIRAEHPDAGLLLACPQTFHRLFAQFDGIELLPPDAAPAYDCQLPLMSLPGALGVTLDNLPTAAYLQPMSGAQPTLAGNGKLKVGVVWESGRWGVGIADAWRQHKSVPPALFAEICRVPGIDFVALQPGELPAELQGLVTQTSIGDFADTAALLEQVELVVCVDTAILHLAGAMGKPTWALLRAESAPFFLADAAVAPWYPSVRLWRQAAPGDWLPVVRELAEALSAQQTF
ncbi:tetratricopeptide repeat protein [Chromobacterium amazonense]|uniref:tetratricopeptide repeat-containing glycosyltransferase family protein n=1 Tax=Chromobacterium amazonense TaxID=1382803 RepID=UPI000AFC3B0B|nr:tetratricopeptide repeat-containing glycosyltransferase family protein [Chromobacterium amazonense]